MKVEILEVHVDGASVNWIKAHCDNGSFWAIWSDGEPLVGKSYYVDVAIDEVVNTDSSVRLAAEKIYSIAGESRESAVHIVGQVRKNHEDKLVELQFGDKIIDLQVDEIPPAGEWLEFTVYPVKLFDINI